MSGRIISIADIGDFYVNVKYKRTNRHKTKIFTVTANPVKWPFFVDVGTFHIMDGNQIKYISKPNVLDFLSVKIQKAYNLNDLLELFVN